MLSCGAESSSLSVVPQSSRSSRRRGNTACSHSSRPQPAGAVIVCQRQSGRWRKRVRSLERLAHNGVCETHHNPNNLISLPYGRPEGSLFSKQHRLSTAILFPLKSDSHSTVPSCRLRDQQPVWSQSRLLYSSEKKSLWWSQSDSTQWSVGLTDGVLSFFHRAAAAPPVTPSFQPRLSASCFCALIGNSRILEKHCFSWVLLTEDGTEHLCVWRWQGGGGIIPNRKLIYEAGLMPHSGRRWRWGLSVAVGGQSYIKSIRFSL